MQKKIIIVNIKFYKGRYEYIGRPSLLGNPFSIKDSKFNVKKVSDIDECIDRYEEYLIEEILKGNKEIISELQRLDEIAKSEDGLILGCFCFPFNRCHGEIIKDILENDLLNDL